MTPEAARHLEKAHQCLANARISLGVNLSDDAGRGAYLAVFHSAQAFIFERAGKFARTHQGVYQANASFSAFSLADNGEIRVCSVCCG